MIDLVNRAYETKELAKDIVRPKENIVLTPEYMLGETIEMREKYDGGNWGNGPPPWSNWSQWQNWPH